MREIKFRACVKTHNNKIYPVAGITFGGGYSGDGRSVTCIGDGMIFSVDLKDVELLQYTGLKDKDGKEIYEGDLLKYLPHYPHDMQEKYPWRVNGRIAGPVEWVDGWLYACRKYKNDEQLLIGENNGGPVRDWEVIGNIYENPDLLKV